MGSEMCIRDSRHDDEVSLVDQRLGGPESQARGRARDDGDRFIGRILRRVFIRRIVFRGDDDGASSRRSRRRSSASRGDVRAGMGIRRAREHHGGRNTNGKRSFVENVRSLETFVRSRPTSRARVSVVPRARSVGNERYPSQCVWFILGARSLFFPFAPISLVRIRTFECSRITMPLRASSEALTSDRDSKNGGVSMRRPSSVRDSITASMPRCQSSVRLIWTDFQASRLRTSQ